MVFLRLLEDIKHRFLVLTFLEVVPDFHFAHQSATCVANGCAPNRG
jgi:hypothetical protein